MKRSCQLKLSTNRRPECFLPEIEYKSLRMEVTFKADETLLVGDVRLETSPVTTNVQIHSGNKCLTYDNYDVKFSKAIQLNEQLQTHTSKTHGCDLCGKKFRLLRYLKRHCRTHTNEKRYSCNVCSKEFARNCNLNDHYRIHTNEKTLSCSICGKEFYKKSHLNEHYRVHTNEKPHSCDVCGKAFSAISTLRAHFRTHTQEKPYSCELWGKRITLVKKGPIKHSV